MRCSAQVAVQQRIQSFCAKFLHSCGDWVRVVVRRPLNVGDKITDGATDRRTGVVPCGRTQPITSPPKLHTSIQQSHHTCKSKRLPIMADLPLASAHSDHACYPFPTNDAEFVRCFTCGRVQNSAGETEPAGPHDWIDEESSTLPRRIR